MSWREEVLADMALAEDIKRSSPGSTVSTDAIFLSLRLKPKTKERSRQTSSDVPPPDWFKEALAQTKGWDTTVGRILLFAGKLGARRSDVIAIGRWLRQSGYVAYRSGSETRFRMNPGKTP